jgi:uncharacterized protein YndB with AHSA1/START domain
VNTTKLKVTAQGDREIQMTREFNAPRAMVFDACTRPELVQRWLLGPEGWSLPVCEIDLRVGGRLRYVWKHTSRGTEMGLTGVFREIVVPERIVHTEKFDQPWYPGEAVITTQLTERGGTTTLTMTLLYESKEIRDGVIQSPMEEGVGVSYDRLEAVLASRPAHGAAQTSRSA